MKINKETLQNYVDCLKKQSNSSSFIEINSNLISKSIEFEENKCLLITLKARREIQQLLFSILDYAKNKYAFIPVIREPIEIGDLVFYDKKAWRVNSIVGLNAEIKYLIENKILEIPISKLNKIKNTIQRYRRRNIDFNNPNLPINGDTFIAYSEWICDITANFPQHKEHEIQNNTISKSVLGAVLLQSGKSEALFHMITES